MLVVFFVGIDAVQATPQKSTSSGTCTLVEGVQWASFSESLKGKELVAFASWCSSCREKLMSIKSRPDRFVFVSVFEEAEQSMRAMNRLGLTSACIYGPDLATRLEIDSLPWSRKM